jgi:hypothetical protein
MTCDRTTSIGAYLLGGLDYPEWQDIDRHLPDCEICRAEIVRLAGLPGLIGRLPLDEVIAGDADLAPPARSNRRSARRRHTSLAVAAAALVLALAGTLGGIAATETGTAKVTATASATWSTRFALSGSNPSTGVQGGASLTAKSWGTEIWVQLNGVPPHLQCDLVVHTSDGRAIAGGAWSSDATRGVWVPASAPVGPSQIANLDIATSAGSLVTLTR